MQVAIFEGEEGFVFFELADDERRRLIDGQLIHNHPPDRNLAVDDPRYDAASFSPFDWRIAAELDVSVMIVVSPTWRHQLYRPASGWFAVYPSLDDFLDMFNLLFAHVEEVDKRRVAGGSTTKEAAEALRMHEVSRIFAGEIEASYRREQR